MKKIIVIYLLLLETASFSQVGGESIFQFLNINSSSRQIALGGEALTLINDVNQPNWNPSVINPELDKQLSLNYTSYLAGISIGSASYSQVINRRFGAIHGSIKYLNYGILIEADENGNETGTFQANDIALSIGYAFNLPWTNIYMGVNGKLINSTISNFTSNGIATDVAVLYYSPYKSYAFTLVARNIGTQVKSFDGENEKIPFKVAIGGSYKLKYVPLKWHVTMDNLQKWNIAVPNPTYQTSDLEGVVTKEKISFLKNAIRHIVIGAEFFPDSPINLRAGYNFRRSSELRLQNARSFSGISFGFGIKIDKLRVNYAFSKYHAATSSSTFSLQFDLDNR
tara:strand:+ start:112 stop:1131 length:1020 start_codon:yes stop_codon:yes gene_type:complete